MQKKVLITGITGFAGSHLAEVLVAEGNNIIHGTHVSDRHLKNIEAVAHKVTLHKVNLLDAEATATVVGEVQPDVVYHLAASTFVADSFKKPAEFITNNASSQIHILEALRLHGKMETKVLVVSSAHTYGLVAQTNLPVKETLPFRPDNPYSVSKITQDYLGLSYFLAYKMPIVRVRPFNHIGPRLSPDISISRFAKMIAQIEKGSIEPIMKVGNMSARRDFTDVRDMVKGYVLALDLCIPGEVYNIGTGMSFSMQEMLDKLLLLSTAKITVETDQSFFRPSDIPDLRADRAKFTAATGWKPQIPLEKTLQDTLDYWRALV